MVINEMYQHRRHWMKHTAMVPKGFIRYQVLESLSQKPMSGSEIIDEIESRTDGQWKPSPGSIYPLLAWLQDNGHVKELPPGQSGLKRYELTESGRALLVEQKKIMDDQQRIIDKQRRIHDRLKKEGRFFGPPFMAAPWFRIPSEKTSELRRSVRRLMASFIELGIDLEKGHSSKQIVEEAQKALEEAAEKLEEIHNRLKGREHE
jgi:DNA-binding PadR family transcriptional regulator